MTQYWYHSNPRWLYVCVEAVKWQKFGPSLHDSRGVITLPMSVSVDRAGSGGYRGHVDRRHSGPSSYHHQHPVNGNHSGSYNAGGGGGYRGRGKPVSGHGPPRWSAGFSVDRLNGHGRGGFGRGGRYYNSRGRSFDTRTRGPSGDDFAHKYYGNCDVRPVRGNAAPAKPRGFYQSPTSAPAPRFS